MTEGHDSSEYHEALWVVEAESSHLARESVVARLAQETIQPSSEIRNYDLSYLEPVQVGTEEGRKRLDLFWNCYTTDINRDISTIYQEMTADATYQPQQARLNEVDVPDTIQRDSRIHDSLEFKSACYRVGNINGWPIRIFWDGIGLNLSSQISDLKEQDPGAWIVQVKLS